MFNEATSGLNFATGLRRSSIVMVEAPPVVMFTTQFDCCLMSSRNGRKRSGDWSGLPSAESRACRCTIAAPAAALPISAAVTGRCGDIEGVWIDPVTAQVTMTLRFVIVRQLPKILAVVADAAKCLLVAVRPASGRRQAS